jgi:GAF domain-containing protein
MAALSAAPSALPETPDETIRRLTAELHQAYEHQAAATELLQTINTSPGDLAPVFDAMLEKAIRLCGGDRGALWTIDDSRGHLAAARGLSAKFTALLRERGESGTNPPLQQIIGGERLIEFPDTAESEFYRSSEPLAKAAVEAGVRSLIWVALVKEGVAIGAFAIGRSEVGAFTDKQIALLQNFAAQAVIAMENARLITETREALEQQTATAEVLQVINSSPGDLAPVFEAMLEKAHSLCGADNGALLTYDGERFWPVAWHGMSTQFADARSEGIDPEVAPSFGRIVRGERLDHIHDMVEFAAHVSDNATRRRLSDLIETGGIRTQLIVPLRKDDLLLGAITANRKVMRPFTDKQIALLQNFAAQAVIAMENARLLTETREALEQQTATAEILQVINSSPGDLTPVFEAILEKAHGLCRIAIGAMELYESGKFRAVAVRGLSGPLAELLREPFEPLPESPFARLLAGEPAVQITDVSELAPLRPDSPRAQLNAQYGLRTALFVPLRKDAALLGHVVALRQEVQAFSDKEIALLQNFAAQAVIAMENARLINETREALEQQTATAEVLQVINSSPGELKPVFDAILEKAHTLCGVALGSLVLNDGERLRAVATHGYPAKHEALAREGQPSGGPFFERLSRGEVVQLPDMASLPAPTAMVRSAVEIAGSRTYLAIPLRKDGALLGYLSAHRQEVRPFSDKQIALLQNFAQQAVIAMENARLITETREALEQQTATAEVLQVINSSPGDLAPVFDAMLEKAMRLCGAAFGSFLTFDGEHFLAVVHRGVPAELVESLRQPQSPTPGGSFERLVHGERIVHLADISDDDAYRRGLRGRVAMVDIGGARTAVWVALRRDDAVLGTLVLYRQEVRPFSDKQIALLQNFGAQAVIAMENARLLTETREALEQQTATAEVLQVINSSPGDLVPVFEAMLDRAIRLCEAAHGHLLTYDGECFHPAADSGEPHYIEWARQVSAVRPAPKAPLGRISRGERIVHIADLREEEVYHSDSGFREQVDIRGARSQITVGLLKDNILLGAMIVYRQEVRPFSEKQIALVENFAAQAVVAMENARLITETREALEQQTATADVLGVINSSPGDLAPVFDSILEKAHMFCGAARGALMVYDREHFWAVATHGIPEAFGERLRQPFRANPDSPQDRLLHGERLIHIPDVRGHTGPASEGPAAVASTGTSANAHLAMNFIVPGVRTLLMVPLRKDDALLGYIAAHRREVRPFSDKQIALLQNFAAQAVIAMENARLITETREALEQQTATAEVLQVINSSPGDLVPVFEAMLDKAIRLCEATHGHFFTYDGECFHLSAARSDARYVEWARQAGPVRPHPTTPLGLIKRGERIVHVADIRDDEGYRAAPAFQESVELRGVRSQIAVALFKDNVLLGAMNVYRQEVRPFSDKQVGLLENFAAQAVIAMENARLITETREALEQQTATAEVLQVINSSPGNLTPVFETILEKAHTLCGATLGDLMIFDGEQFRLAAVRAEPRFVEYWRQNPVRPPREGSGPLSQLMRGERIVHLPDVRQSDAYRDIPDYRHRMDLGDISTLLVVPLRKDRALLGTISAYRQEVRPFSDKQIALLEISPRRR